MAEQPMKFSNRFRTTCSACKKSLYKGEGWTTKEDGNFVNYCNEHFLRKYEPGVHDAYFDKINTIIHGRPDITEPKE